MSLVRGWCPGALRPMLSGDGWVLRIRPRLARLTAAEVAEVCAVAESCATGLIDLTNRANLQIRGLREASIEAAQARLAAAGLLDADPEAEARRNILTAPDWAEGDDTARIARDLTARMRDLPALPGKAGFAVDAGPAPILTADPGDFRIERGRDGQLILRADGRLLGVPVTADRAAQALVDLAAWFTASGGAEAGRMARHAAPLPQWAAGTKAPAPPRAPIAPGGAALGLPFGQVAARDLAALLDKSGAPAIRLTPWRVLVLEGATDAPPSDGFITDPTDPALRADACPGAPHCPQATVATRSLARRLAPLVTGRLHVSGCAKGCARPGAAEVVLTGRDGAFDLALNARAGDPAIATALAPETLPDRIRTL